VVQRDDVAALEDVANRVIGAVLALCPQPQCGEQLCGFVDEVTAGLGVAEFVGVGLDLSLRPGKQLVQAVHGRILLRPADPSPGPCSSAALEFRRRAPWAL
jgi:hypothetical protein